MNTKIVSALIILAISTSIAAPFHAISAEEPLQAGIDRPSPQPGTLGMAGSVFTENRGQVVNPDILYYAASGLAAFTADSVILYASGQDSRSAVKLSFPGSNAVIPEAHDPVAWHSNYLRGSDPDGWQTGLTNYRSVVYRNLWDGIDLVYRFENLSLKYEFILRPNADHSRIVVRAEGQETLSVASDGSLVMGIGQDRSITDSGLDVFYADDSDEKVSASFTLIGDGKYGFSLEDRDPDRGIVIDPLIYSTYLGGSGQDYITDVAAGDDGCAYITGYTDSPDFPSTYGSYQDEWLGIAPDAFVVKMGLNGDSVVYATYIGDVAGDYAKAIAVDSSGHAYIAGYTMSYGYPTTEGAFQTEYGGDTYDAFVTKLAPYGDYLVYSTFLGGTRVDFAYDIAVDRNGFAYLTGETWPIPVDGPPQPFRLSSGDFSFPTTPDSFTWGSGLSDIFVTKLDQLGGSLVYSAAFGTNDYDYSNSIAVDENGYAYITGMTRSELFPVSTYALDRTYNGGYDVFAFRLSQTGTSYVFSTFLGGTGGDYGTTVTVGPWGHVYITGQTSSADFPTSEGAYDKEYNGASDVFAVMLNKYGDSLGYSTYVGGSGSDIATDMVLDAAGCVFITGYTNSDSYPVTVNALDPTYNGGSDGFMSKLSASGMALQQSTYLGGAGNDYPRGMASGPDGFAYIAGETLSPDFPLTGGSLDTTSNGNADGFVTKLDIGAPATDAGPNQWIAEGETALFDGSGTADNDIIVNYTWAIYDGSEIFTVFGPTAQHTYMTPGVYSAILNVTDASANWATDALLITVLDVTDPIAMGGPDRLINEDNTVTFNASASSDNVGIVNYTWTFTEASLPKSLFGISPSYNFTLPGIYDITLRVRDAAGNAALDTLQVTVVDITPPTANAGSDIRIYRETNVRLDGMASRDNLAIVNYTWKFSDGTQDFIVHTAAFWHLFSVPGVYNVSLEVSDAAGFTSTDWLIIVVLETVPPVAEAGPDITADQGAVTAFDGSGSTDNIGVAQWFWSFWDGQNQAGMYGAAPYWIFPVPGQYLVTLNVTDAAGNWHTDTLTVTVLDRTAPVPAAGPNRIVLAGTNVSFDGSMSTDASGIAAYTWSFTYNGTLAELSGSAPSFRFWVPGVYNVTLTVTDTAGNTASEMLTVTVYELPTGAEVPGNPEYGWTLIYAAIALFVAGTAIMVLRRKRGANP